MNSENQSWNKMSKFLIPLLFLSLLPLPVSADAFDPNLLISDERFVDTGTLGGAEGIQKFLESKGSVLANTSPNFLVKLREPVDVTLKKGLPDPRPELGRLRTAAELIFDAATSAGLNPQVVLTTLQKEQTLITGQFLTDQALQRGLDRALGFGCPDSGVCGEIFLGFYHQLFGNFDAEGNRYIGMPASLARSFYFEVGGVRVGRGPMVDATGNAYGNGSRIRTSQRGDTIVVENTQGPPNSAPATQGVTLSNFATTALFRYTPHVYNGNYNFWKFFNEWFRYPNGTLITLGDGKIFVIDEGLRRPISGFVIVERGLNPGNTITVSSLELNEFSFGEVMPPVDGTLIGDAAGRVFLIELGQRKLLSSFVAVQRKLNLATATALPDDEMQSYKDGGVALPEEGTLVKSRDNPAVYIITNNQKRLLSAFVFKQRGFKFVDVLVAEPGELDTYPPGPLMSPLDGTLIKANEEPLVYHVGNGLLEPLTYFVFKQRAFNFKNVVLVPKNELSGWTTSKLMPPETGVLVKSKADPTVYYMEAGVKRPVSYGVFLASRFSFANVLAADDAELILFEKGEDLPLPERAVVKAKDSATVYYVVDGILRPLTFTAFQNRRLRFEDVITIPAEEVPRYQIGPVVEN